MSLTFDIYTDLNIWILTLLFIFPVLNEKYLSGANLDQTIKIVC